MSKRELLLRGFARTIAGLPADRIAKVAIDGVDGAGKTKFADELGQYVREESRPVIRAGVDDFHNPRAVRYARGRDSPEGYFADAFNYAAVKTVLLDPLSAGGSGLYRAAVFDHRTDAAVTSPERQALPGSILIFDGVFLHRPELRDHWDFSIFLATEFVVSVARGAQRDGTSPDPAAASNRRYVEAQKLYLRSCNPRVRATVTIDHNDLSAPFVVRASRPE
jgi:uridine kinase